MDIYLIIYLLNRWIYWTAKNSDFKAKHNSDLNNFSIGFNDKNSKLNKNKMNNYAFLVLNADKPPNDFTTLKLLIFSAEITVNGKPLGGEALLREVIGRIDYLEKLLDKELRGVNEITQQLVATHNNNNNVFSEAPIATEGLQELEAWKTEEIWEETFDLYKDQKFIHLLTDEEKNFKDLKALSLGNIKKIAADLRIENIDKFKLKTDLPLEYEQKIFKRIFQGKIFFKHGTWSMPQVQRSGMLLCSELGGFSGVSERNAKYAHNKYVFGRMEFTEKFWETKFGNEKVMFEIRELENDISISLHDQEQPFALDKHEKGHTQEIKFGGNPLRTIKGQAKKQSWVQIYGDGVDEEKKIKTSFINEVFAGQNQCRTGIALSLIREIRRIVKYCDPGAVEQFINNLNSILESKDDQKFQDFVKQFFRIEIRAPAYVNLKSFKKSVTRFDENKKKSELNFLCKSLPALDKVYDFTAFVFKKLSICKAMISYHWFDKKLATSGRKIFQFCLKQDNYKNLQKFAEILKILNKKDSKPTIKDPVTPYLELKKYYHLINNLFQYSTTEIYECPCGHIQWVTTQMPGNLISIAVKPKKIEVVVTEINQAPDLNTCTLAECQGATQVYKDVIDPKDLDMGSVINLLYKEKN